MVACVPSSNKSKIAPRRHWTSMQGLLRHSRQLHHVLETAEEQDDCVRPRELRGELHLVQHRQPIPQARPIVFRKTKREIQRERERAQQLQAQQAPADAHLRSCAIPPEAKNARNAPRRVSVDSSGIMRQLDSFRSTLLASCKRLTTHRVVPHSSCRAQYLRRSSGLGLSRRCPPRRRLLF